MPIDRRLAKYTIVQTMKKTVFKNNKTNTKSSMYKYEKISKTYW